MNYLLHILILISIYGILGSSLNLVVGYTGMLSLCHAAFFGIGAYASTLLQLHLGLGFLPSLLVAGGGAGLMSVVIGIPTVRLKGDYFVLGTLAFQMIVFSALYNWTAVTGGPYGITGIPIPTLLSFELDSPLRYGVFCVSAGVACYLFTARLINSPFGRLLKAVREDELASRALGKDVFAARLTVFGLGALLAGFGGGIFAGHLRFISPISFDFADSIFFLSVLIIGGAGSLAGPFLGAAFMVLVPEALRMMELQPTLAADLHQIIYGVLLVVIVRFRPRGLLGAYAFR